MLFPGYSGGQRATGAALRREVEARLAQVRSRLAEQVFRGLHHRCRVQGGRLEDCRACEGCVSDRFSELLDVVEKFQQTLVESQVLDRSLDLAILNEECPVPGHPC